MRSVEAILKEDLAREQIGHNEYLKLVEFARQYEGKKITRAIENKLPAGYKLQEGRNAFEIIAPSGNNHSFIRIEYKNDFSLARFAETNAPYSRGAPERIEKLSAILNDPNKLKEFEDFYKELRTAYLHLKHLADKANSGQLDSYHNPAFYDILREFGIESRILSDLHFDKRGNGGKMARGGFLGRRIAITW